MSEPAATFYFDFVDPLSYLVALELEDLAEEGYEIRWSPLEIWPPPRPLTQVGDPLFSDRWARARSVADEAGVALNPPELVPWSRKAHELHAYAESMAIGQRIRRSIFEAYFVSARDIGRVDVLVDIARQEGLDITQAKASLDVDRFDEEVAAARVDAASSGVSEAPVLALGDSRLEGFHNRTTLRTFLRGT